MLLSPTDRIRFTVLYPDLSHDELSMMFAVTKLEIIETAKKLGIFDTKRREKDIMPSEKKL